ncbi:fluoroquinolone export ABC transporter permease subunit [Nocardiopsis aegyptia]|uniref:Fluoroquinolone transport system permease protein n=1 Tax=Nocardiopsis aegyptia TaxID=220378 RepID=A0A7Z0J803_9ACTN|nr:fluoroquinolone transporter permease [Nocardiopsis aegyptia]NYJ32431.1 fluoroquinolone transport system permease protein [Nocardiopsis aegyptia]
MTGHADFPATPPAPTMAGFGSALRLELRLQWRYGFLYAAAFSAALWLVVLFPIPDAYRDVVAPLVLFGDLTIVAFFFIAGALFFEKNERTLFAVVVSPLRFGIYLSAKLLTLTLLSVVLSFAIVLPVHGFGFSVLPMLTGVLVTAVLLLLLSFVTAVPYSSITDWLMPSTFWLGLVNVPLLHYAGLWEHPVVYLIPTQGSLILLGSAFGRLDPAPWEYAYAVGYQLVWIGALALLARRLFDRYVVAGEGT